MADKPKDKKKADPESFLLRPDEVAEMRQAAIKGGMSPEEFTAHLEDMRKKLRATGQLHIPPKLKAAITKGSDRKAPKGLQKKFTKRAESRASKRQGKEPKFVYGKLNPNYRGPGGSGGKPQGKPVPKIIKKDGKFVRAGFSAVEHLETKLSRQ